MLVPLQIYNECFNGSSIDCYLNLKSDYIKNHEVLKWEITSIDSTKSRSSYVMANDIILQINVCVDKFRMSYPFNHKLFNYYELVNNYDGTINYESKLVTELIRLRKDNICLNYVDFLLCHFLSTSQNSNVVKIINNELNVDSMIWNKLNKTRFKFNINFNNTIDTLREK